MFAFQWISLNKSRQLAQTLENKAAADFSNLPSPQTALYNLGARPGENILHNAIWTRPEVIINQRHDASGDKYDWQYAFDRWIGCGQTGYHLEYRENGIEIRPKDDDTLPVGFMTRFERAGSLLGKTLTASALVDGKLYTGSGVLPEFIVRFEHTDTHIQIALNEPGSDIARFQFYISEPHLFQAAKLELGPVQTLARQNAEGTWELIDPLPDPALELLKCQRYQFVIGNRLFTPFGTFVSRASGHASTFIPLPTMRAVPTVTFHGNFRAITSNRETVGSNLVGVISGWSASGVEIAIHSFEGLSVGDTGWLDTRDSNAMVIFDANL